MLNLLSLPGFIAQTVFLLLNAHPMIKHTLTLTCLLAGSVLLAQPGAKNPAAKPAQKPATKTTVKTPVKQATPAPVLKTLDDSASYAVGISISNFYKQQGVTHINTALVSRAINDVMGKQTPLMDDNAANTVMNNYLNKMQQEKSKTSITAGENFLAANKQRPEVKTTPSGLQYEVLREGSGEKPNAIDSVTCHYRGTLVDGTPFDNSYDRGEPITFELNRVIPGWTEGLQLMTVGSKYKLYIPYTLGYGTHDVGAIPGGSCLIFEVELLDVKRKK